MNVKDFVSVLGNPLGDEYSVFDLLEETPDFSGENPVLLLHPTGLSFGRAVSSALSIRKGETPVGVCLGDGSVFVTTLEAVGEYDELLDAGSAVVIGGSKTRFLEDEEGDVCGIVSE